MQKYLVTLLCFFSINSFAIQVLFVPANGEGQILDDSGQHPELCRQANSLPGLNLTRQLVGVPGCNGVESAASTVAALRDEIDLLVLVNDTRGIEDDLQQRIDSADGERLLCESVSRSYAFPAYFQLRGDQALRVLFVGEKIYNSYFTETADSAPWQQFLIKLVQRAQSTDAPADSGLSPSVHARAANNIPLGKGLFQNRALRDLVHDRYKPYKMDHMAQRFHDHELNWFAMSANVAGKCEGRLYAEFIRFGHPNFQFFIWSLNNASNISGQIDEMLAAAKSVQANGIVIDIEGQAFRSHAAAARELYRVGREKVNEYSSQPGNQPLSLGVTVIGFSPMANYLNMDDLAAADFVMPQIYNREDNLSATEMDRRIDYWLTTFSEHTKVVLVAGAHHCDIDPEHREQSCSSERAKNATEFDNTAAYFRGKARDAIGWWRYGSIESGNHWQRVRDFDLTMSE